MKQETILAVLLGAAGGYLICEQIKKQQIENLQRRLYNNNSLDPDSVVNAVGAVAPTLIDKLFDIFSKPRTNATNYVEHD